MIDQCPAENATCITLHQGASAQFSVAMHSWVD